MGNVLYTYDEILKVSVLWQYWDSYKPPVRNPFESNEEAFKFISQFVDESGKDFNNELSNEFEKIKDRSLHTLSTYFLGIIIYHKFPKIQNIIDTEIKKYQELNLKSKINFQYLWYLISIFHDFGFRYENDNTFPDLVAFQVGKKKLTVPPATIPHEIAKVWRKYFTFKEGTRAKCDHGIIGGLFLYAHLRKISPILNKNNKLNPKGLFFGKELYPAFRMASWVILSHNIYFIKEKANDAQINSAIHVYKKCGLKSLILQEKEIPKINFTEHPFLSLLCLVDTIEPYKITQTKCNTSSIENYNIDFMGDKIYLEIKELDKYRKLCISSMGDWLKVHVVSKESNNFEISFL